jgi:hypothetical protein
MYSDVESHVVRRISAAAIIEEPFPHCVIDGIFPEHLYESIIDFWPQEPAWRPLGESGRVSKDSYAERKVVLMTEQDLARLDPERRQFWQQQIAPWLIGPSLRTALLAKFRDELARSGFAAAAEQTMGDALIVSDRTNYAIGPHTDAPHRVVSLLFYLPEDATFRRFGTSLYVPKDRAFRCAGGPHHAFDKFYRGRTIEFVPNRLVVFPKSDHCFHGVERVDLQGIERRLLIFNVRRSS